MKLFYLNNTSYHDKIWKLAFGIIVEIHSLCENDRDKQSLEPQKKKHLLGIIHKI